MALGSAGTSIRRFDGGWDKLREETFARQKQLGVIPADAVLTKRPDEIPAYDDVPEVLKPILAREMEVYAGFLAHTDHHVGRLLDTLEELKILDDTLIYLIFGDNGASAEGTPNGCFNEVAVLNGMATLETHHRIPRRLRYRGLRSHQSTTVSVALIAIRIAPIMIAAFRNTEKMKTGVSNRC